MKVQRLNGEHFFKKFGYNHPFYYIKNIIDSKVYVGKSKNIYNRIQEHIYSLRHKRKDENRHLINAWHKYGENAFEYFVLEETKLDEDLLKEHELY